MELSFYDKIMILVVGLLIIILILGGTLILSEMGVI